VWVSAWVNDVAARLRGKTALFSVDKARDAMAGTWTCSAQKAIDQLGFSTGAPLIERLRQTFQWYRQHEWL
jgi:hypothetical protein